MIKNLLTLFFLTITTLLFAQSYNDPESVDYHSGINSFVVSNSGNGQILTEDELGNLNVLASGVGTGPYGLEVIGDVVYACSGGRLKGYNVLNGSQILNHNINGQFLNGITHKGNDIFITDFSGKKLFKYNTTSGNHNLFASFNSTPNGVVYDYINDRLLVVGWGSNAPVWEVSLSDSSVSVLATTNHSNIDGIALDPCGNYYISVWGNNAIYQYDVNFSSPQILATGQSQPADIFYETNSKRLVIPNSGNNTVNFISINCTPTNLEEEITRPFYISQNYLYCEEGKKSLYNTNGQLIWEKSAMEINIENLSSGIYILKFGKHTEKICIE